MLEHQEQSLANAYSFSPISNEKDDLLKSVHNWMEEEKMKTIVGTPQFFLSEFI